MSVLSLFLNKGTTRADFRPSGTATVIIDRFMMWAMRTVTILALSFINLAGIPSYPVALLALIFRYFKDLLFTEEKKQNNFCPLDYDNNNSQNFYRTCQSNWEVFQPKLKQFWKKWVEFFSNIKGLKTYLPIYF